MLETTETVKAIAQSTAEVQTMLTKLIAQVWADAWHVLWTQTPLWFRVLVVVALVAKSADSLGLFRGRSRAS